MGCGYCGEFKQKQQYPEGPIIFECPEYGSEYRPEQEHNGEIWTSLAYFEFFWNSNK
jgi:hypothetical protein